MSLNPDYTLLADIKALMGITDTVDDDALELAITASSRMVDHFCRRQFGSATNKTREYDITGRKIAIEDFTSVSKIETRPKWSTTLTEISAGTGYRLLPINASAKGQPYTHVEIYDQCLYGEYVLKVTGTVGWSSVPAQVEQATQIQAIRLFKRKDSPYGVAGSIQDGSELRLLSSLDPDVQVLLRSVRRNWGMV